MDTIADFITRVRNGARAQHDKVDVPSSNMRKGIAQVLKDEGFIQDFAVVPDGKQGVMRVYLKYTNTGKSVIHEIQRVSRPGRRVYVRAKEMPPVRSGYGVGIISTSKGVTTLKGAVDKNVGGEFLVKVW